MFLQRVLLQATTTSTSTSTPSPTKRETNLLGYWKDHSTTNSYVSSYNNYHDNSESYSPVMILACSVVSSSSSSGNGGISIRQEHLDLFTTRRLCQDRKGWFDHLYPLNFSKNSFRIVVLQSSQVISHYFTDQLKLEVERDEKVRKGEITRLQADMESDLWAEREWKLRIESLPNRIGIALAKYHAVTFVMRLYEYIASKYVTEVTLDKLTLDTVDCAKRTAREQYSGTSSSTSLQSTTQYTKTMFESCFNANIIAYLADYSVHQLILLYGYYLYVQHIRSKSRGSTNKTIQDSENNSGAAIESGSIALSFFKKSTLLIVQRAICLASGAFGGAIGSVLLPGLGTMAGFNVGDALAINATEQFVHTDAPTTTSSA